MDCGETDPVCDSGPKLHLLLSLMVINVFSSPPVPGECAHLLLSWRRRWLSGVCEPNLPAGPCTASHTSRPPNTPSRESTWTAEASSRGPRVLPRCAPSTRGEAHTLTCPINMLNEEMPATCHSLFSATRTEIIFLWEMWEALRWDKCGRSRIKEKKMRIPDPEKALLLRRKKEKDHMTSQCPRLPASLCRDGF